MNEKNREKAKILFVALCWMALSLITLSFTDHWTRPCILWFFALWGWCLINLFFLRKLVASLASMRSDQVRIWFLFKTITWILLGITLWKIEKIPVISLTMGMLTLVVVPVFFGLWDGFKSKE
jgi:hypothetical protein